MREILHDRQVPARGLKCQGLMLGQIGNKSTQRPWGWSCGILETEQLFPITVAWTLPGPQKAIGGSSQNCLASSGSKQRGWQLLCIL